MKRKEKKIATLFLPLSKFHLYSSTTQEDTKLSDVYAMNESVRP